jgi:hypothetical protein
VIYLELKTRALHQLCPRGIFVRLTSTQAQAVTTRGFYTDRTDRTGGVRYRFTRSVRSETGRNRKNSNFKQKHAVQTVPTGVPTGSTGSRPFNQKKPISGEFDVFSNLNEKLKK